MNRPACTDAYAFFHHPGPLPLAHRGGAKYGPNHSIENSMRAFANAIELGYRYLETDVHATADGVLVAFHDTTLQRVTDREGRIAELSYAEVSRARIGGQEPIPRLEDLLGSWPQVRVNIDVKAAPAIGPLAEVIRRTNAQDRVCIASFSWARLRAVRRLLPQVATSLAPTEVAALRFPPRPLARLVASTAPCVQIPTGYKRVHLLTRRFIDTVHAFGMQVHVWTVDDAQRMRELLDLGVDGIVSDRIDVLRDVLMERGQWVGP